LCLVTRHVVKTILVRLCGKVDYSGTAKAKIRAAPKKQKGESKRPLEHNACARVQRTFAFKAGKQEESRRARRNLKQEEET
jgi:hypothetical protein